MKPTKFFFGAFLIACGVFLLFPDFFSFIREFDIPYAAITIIIIGIVVMLNSDPRVKAGIFSLMGIVCSMFLFSTCYTVKDGANFVINQVKQQSDESQNNLDTGTVIQNIPFTEPTREASLKIETHVENLMITSDYLDSTFLFYSESGKSIFDHEIESKNENGKALITFSMNGASTKFLKKDTAKQHGSNPNIKLHTTPIWDIDIESGAANGSFDLSSYKVRSLSVESGVSSMKLKLGDKFSKVNVEIESAASSVNILIPRSATCRVIAEKNLSDLKANHFVQTGHNEYLFKGTSNLTITIKAEANLSSLAIEQY